MTDLDKPKLTTEERRAAALEKREALKVDFAAAFAEQQVNDLEALVELEAEHGFGRVIKIDIGGWKAGEGAATLVVVRVPRARDAFFKRYEETVTKAKEGTTARLEAAHMLTESCLLYPSKKDQKELYDATFDLAAGIRTHLAIEISKAVQGSAEEEKKD